MRGGKKRSPPQAVQRGGFATAALSRRRKLRFSAACQSNPSALLRYVSSSQKVLRYFLGALLFCSVCSFGRALGFGARARSARVTVRRQPHRQLCRRLVYKPSARITAILEKAANVTKNIAKLCYRTALKMIQIKERTAAERLKIMPIRDSRLFVFEFLKISSILLHN